MVTIDRVRIIKLKSVSCRGDVEQVCGRRDVGGSGAAGRSSRGGSGSRSAATGRRRECPQPRGVELASSMSGVAYCPSKGYVTSGSRPPGLFRPFPCRGALRENGGARHRARPLGHSQVSQLWAYGSVHIHLTYCIIWCNNFKRRSMFLDPTHPSVPATVENIADAVTHARFVGTDHSSDGVVLMKILQVIYMLRNNQC